MDFLVKITYLKCDMVISNPNFELLLSDDIFFRPIRIVFPEKKRNLNVKIWTQVFATRLAYLVISLASTIRFSSFITRGPIHTAQVINDMSEEKKRGPVHFLYGSDCHFGSWNCLHNEDDHGRTRTQGIRDHACPNVQCCKKVHVSRNSYKSAWAY